MKIHEIIGEVDASRRGFLKGMAGAAAAAAMPAVPAGVVKQLVKEIKPSNVGAVKDLMDRFDIRRLYTIFRTWNDPDMWQPGYLLKQEDQDRLFKHYQEDFEEFKRNNPRPAKHKTETKPDDWDDERDGPWEIWGRYEPFGDRRRNPDNYVLFRLLSDNAIELGLDKDELERMFMEDNDDGFEQVFEIYKNNWYKLVPYIEKIVGHKIDISDAIGILQKNGIKDPVSFATNEELWKVLETLYGQSYHDYPWPEGWPSFEEMLKRDNFSVTAKGETVTASGTPPIEPPKNGKQLRSMLQYAMQAATSLLKKGKKPAQPSLVAQPNLNVTLNRPETGEKPASAPAALPAPGPGIDLGLGAKTKDRVPAGEKRARDAAS